MEKKQILDNIEFIMNSEDMWRFEVFEGLNGILEIQYDPHGLSRALARRQIKNIIALSPVAFILDVIHGFNMGTAIKDMIWEEKLSERVAQKHCLEKNPGLTIMYVNARCAQ